MVELYAYTALWNRMGLGELTHIEVVRCPPKNRQQTWDGWLDGRTNGMQLYNLLPKVPLFYSSPLSLESVRALCFLELVMALVLCGVRDDIYFLHNI